MLGSDILKMAPVVPVIVIDDLDKAVPLAKALVKGGIPVLEITLRTPQGADAIKLIKQEVEGAIVGAGTILSTDDLEKALAVGSEFIITPGLTPTLLDAGVECGVPFMPGVANISQLMTCAEKGLKTLKFFPAEASGGAKALKAFAGPCPHIEFCPTGGISTANLADYLALPNVLSVGGSWIASEKLMAAGDWDGITALAQQSCDLVASLKS